MAQPGLSFGGAVLRAAAFSSGFGVGHVMEQCSLRVFLVLGVEFWFPPTQHLHLIGEHSLKWLFAFSFCHERKDSALIYPSYVLLS